MQLLRQVARRLRAIFRKRELDLEMGEEMRAHVEMRTRANLAAGMDASEAQREAARDFGWAESLKETCRDQRGVGWMENMAQDLRFGARQLRQNPGFTLVAVLTLALGIGANTAIFGVINAVLLRPLPYENPGQLVAIWQDTSGTHAGQQTFSPGDLTAVEEQLGAFDKVGAFDIGASFNLTGGDRAMRLNASEATPGFFGAMRVKPLLGRTFLAEEKERAQDKLVVISERLWRSYFAANTNVIGRTIQLDGEGFTLIGVLPSSFKLPENTDLYVPFSFTGAEWLQDRSHYYLQVVGRLKRGVSLKQARAETDAVTESLRSAKDSTWDKNWGLTIIPMQEQVVGKIRPTLLVLFGAVGFVLLIACVNVANLLLMRGTARRKEIALRAALGASPARVITQLLTESVLLSLLGGCAGVFIAVETIRLLSVSLLTAVPRADEIAVNGWLLAFALLITLLAGCFFGLAPALQASKPDLNETLKSGDRGSSASARHIGKRLLVVAEVALAFVLLAGAGLLMRSFLRMEEVDPGFNPSGTLTLQLTLPVAKYPNAIQQSRFVEELLERVAVVPEVKSSGATITLPLLVTWGGAYSIEDRDGAPVMPVDWSTVTPGYFQTMGIPLLRGRDFTYRDQDNAAHVVIISARIAREQFPDSNPVGRRIRVGGDPREIIGVAGDVRPRGLEVEIQPELYLPYAQKASPANFLTVVARTDGKPMALAAPIEGVIAAMDKDLPVADVRTMEQILSDSTASRRLSTILLGTFAGVALVLALVGIYGVVSYSVAQQTREVGIRLALGAQRTEAFKLVLKQGMGPSLLGVLIGLAGALAMTRWLASLLFEVTSFDPLTFAIATLAVTAVAFAGCWLPARRAAALDPMQALRHE